MQAFFDKIQQELADAIDPETNTVGHFVEQIYGTPKGFAAGGLAGDSGLAEESSNIGLLQKLTNAAQKTTIGADSSANAFDNPLGKQSSYGSPTFLASHYTQLGKFFGSGQEPGNRYTDHYTTPQKGQPAQSQNPEDFYARWYNRLRNFAQATEIADRGQTTIRSK